MEWWLVGQAVAKAQVRFSSCRPLNRRLLKCACAAVCRPSSTKTLASPCCSSATTWRSATASPAKRRSPRCSARSRRRRCHWAWRSMACARCDPPAGPRAAYFLACSAAGAGCADLAGADIQRLRSSTGRGDGRGALTRDPLPLLSSATDVLLGRIAGPRNGSRLCLRAAGCYGLAALAAAVDGWSAPSLCSKFFKPY